MQETHVTRRIFSTIGAVAAVLVLAALVGIVGVLYARPVTAQTGSGVPGMRQVTVVGAGDAQGRPDTATVQIGVETEGATSQEALAKNTEQAQAIQQKLKELGIDEKDIQTSSFNIYPNYGQDGRQITGYRVGNSVSVKIRNLDQSGTLLDQVVQAGANSIYGISFSVENPKDLLNQAREQAIQDARASAEQLARASGASLGQVLVITENIGSTPIPMPIADRAMEATSQAVPVEPGQQSFSMNVQVTFELR